MLFHQLTYKAGKSAPLPNLHLTLRCASGTAGTQGNGIVQTLSNAISRLNIAVCVTYGAFVSASFRRCSDMEFALFLECDGSIRLIADDVRIRLVLARKMARGQPNNGSPRRQAATICQSFFSPLCLSGVFPAGCQGRCRGSLLSR
jgi:hypothetical protein